MNKTKNNIPKLRFLKFNWDLNDGLNDGLNNNLNNGSHGGSHVETHGRASLHEPNPTQSTKIKKMEC